MGVKNTKSRLFCIAFLRFLVVLGVISPVLEVRASLIIGPLKSPVNGEAGSGTADSPNWVPDAGGLNLGEGSEPEARQAALLFSSYERALAESDQTQAVATRRALFEWADEVGNAAPTRAAIYLKLGDPDRAMAVCLALLADQPADRGTVLLLGKAASRCPPDPEPLQVLQDYLQRSGPDVEVLYWMARLNEKAFRWHEARNTWLAIARQGPRYEEEGCRNLGRIYGRERNYHQAVRFHLRALSLDQSREETWRGYVEMLTHLFNTPAVEEALPPLKQEALARDALADDDPVLALAHYRVLLEADLNQPRIHEGVGRALVALEFPALALPHYFAVAAMMPDDPAKREQLRAIQEEVSRRAERLDVDLVRTAAEASPHDADAQFQCGVLLHQLQLWEASIPYLVRALKMQPTRVETRKALALSLEALGQRQAAWEILLPAAKEAPGDAALAHQLAALVVHLEKPTPAQRHLALEFARQAVEADAGSTPDWKKTLEALRETAE